MSKAVKSVTRAVSKVVKGVSNVVRGFGRVVQKIASSKLGKIVLAAATIYFGGAAIMGGLQGAAAGSGFLGSVSGAVSGAANGIANAWSALGAATSSAMGGNFAQAGSQLASGIQGAAPISNAAAVAAGSATPLTNAAANAALSNAPLPAATNAAKAGLFSSDLAKYGLISGGMQLAGGAIQGYGQQKAMEDQRAYEEQQGQAARDRMNQNMSAQFQFGAPGDSPMGRTASGLNYAQFAMPTPQYQPVSFVPGQANQPQPQPGLINRQMAGARPFPIYNPALAKYGYA